MARDLKNLPEVKNKKIFFLEEVIGQSIRIYYLYHIIVTILAV